MKRIGRILLCILMITVLFGISIMGNFVVKSENKSKEKKRTAITKEEMKEWAAPDEETLKYYDLGKFSTTLPVIYMNTKGQQILKENVICGNIALLDGNEEAQSVSAVPNSIYRATIKYRGASSYSKFDKKQYRIKFYKNSKENEKKVSLAGMGANSEWVLNGPYLDKTLIRNKLVYDLARELNGWAPDTRFVELFVDGKYQGVYLAVEPVTNGESRLRLAEFGLLSGETAYVVNRDRIDTGTEEIETWGKTKGYTYNALYIRYPSKNKITEKQKEYIKNDISEFEQVLYGENFKNKRSGYQEYIDMDNWVDYFIINEFAMNYFAKIGMLIIAVGICIRIKAVLTLKKAFTLNVQISKEQQLITNGMYKFVRHPAYTGSILSLLGVSIALKNIPAIVIVAICSFVCYQIRINVEEAVLQKYFKEYKLYKEKTYKLFPYIY